MANMIGDPVIRIIAAARIAHQRAKIDQLPNVALHSSRVLRKGFHHSDSYLVRDAGLGLQVLPATYFIGRAAWNSGLIIHAGASLSLAILRRL